jgi:hypothetical protein
LRSESGPPKTTSVIEQQIRARLQRGENFRVWQIHSHRISGLVVEVETKR